jgi:hypothetical protein
MTTYGITPDGFVKKTAAIIKAEIDADIEADLSLVIPKNSESNFYQRNQLSADQWAQVWDMMEELYNCMDPALASGECLENIAAMTGTLRPTDDLSAGVLDRIVLNEGQTIPAGSEVSIGPDGARFRTKEDLVNTLTYRAILSVAAEAVEAGPVLAIAEAIDSIQTPVAGWRAIAAIQSLFRNDPAWTHDDGDTLKFSIDDGAEQTFTLNAVDYPDSWPLPTPAEIAVQIMEQIEGSDAWGSTDTFVGYLFVGSATEEVGSSIQFTGGTGDIVSYFGFTTDRVAGMNSIDFSVGALADDDEAFEETRQEDLVVQGRGNLLAMETRLRQVAGVLDVLIYDNDTLTDDVTLNVRAKSIDPVVYGGDDQEVADAIQLGRGTTVFTDGKDITKSVTRNQGEAVNISISRPTEVDLYIDLTVKTNTDPDKGEVFDTETGPDAVKVAIISKNLEQFGIAADTQYVFLENAPHVVPGVEGVTAFFIDTTPSPVTKGNIPIGIREIGVINAANIDVTVT